MKHIKQFDILLNKSWRQDPTRHQLYGHLPPITKTIQVRTKQTRKTLLEKQGRTHQWCTPIDPHIGPSKSRVDQLEHTYSSYVRIRDVALKTCQKRWTIGRSGERGSGISVLAARHDDDDGSFAGFGINTWSDISCVWYFCWVIHWFFQWFIIYLGEQK